MTKKSVCSLVDIYGPVDYMRGEHPSSGGQFLAQLSACLAQCGKYSHYKVDIIHLQKRLPLDCFNGEPEPGQ